MVALWERYCFGADDVNDGRATTTLDAYIDKLFDGDSPCRNSLIAELREASLARINGTERQFAFDHIASGT
jgi:hypothetical protein